MGQSQSTQTYEKPGVNAILIGAPASGKGTQVCIAKNHEFTIDDTKTQSVFV